MKKVWASFALSVIITIFVSIFAPPLASAKSYGAVLASTVMFLGAIFTWLWFLSYAIRNGIESLAKWDEEDRKACEEGTCDHTKHQNQKEPPEGSVRPSPPTNPPRAGEACTRGAVPSKGCG